MTKYSVVDFKFDGAAFGEALKKADIGALNILAALVGVDETTLSRWKNNGHHPAAPYPNMTNFIATCNLLDLDPRVFFVLDEPPVDPHDTVRFAPVDDNPDTMNPADWSYECRMCGKEYAGSHDRLCSSCRVVWNG